MTFLDVETARKAYLKRLYQSFLIFVISLALFCPLLSILGPIFNGIFISFVIFVNIIVFINMTNKSRILYRKAYKAYFVEQNLKKTFTHLSYDHQMGLNPSFLYASGMIEMGDLNEYFSNDLTTARYKNIGFTQADVHIRTESTDSDGNTTYTTIFRGRVMLFEFPKKFNFKLELIGKKFRAYRVPGKDPATGRKMVKIETESTEFNQTFKIFGQDGFETFYILDPALMVKIQTIAEHYKNKVLLGFYDNKMLVALDDGKDSFEPPRASKPIDEKAETDKVASDIKVITDFVDLISTH